MRFARPRHVHFVPAYIARLHADGAAAPCSASAIHVQGTVVFADIIGYTALTDFHAQRGPEGIETLGRMLGEFFCSLEKLVVTWGGDIVSFAGDSMLILWTHDDDGTHEEVKAHRGATYFAQRARAGIDCGGPGFATRLGIRVAVVSGEFELVTAGGVGGHWHCVVTGAPLADLGARLRSSGPVSLSEEVDGVTGVRAITFRMPAPAVAVDNEAAASTALRAYIATPVLEHLDAGQLERMSEYRVVTVLFVGWERIECHSADGLVRFQASVIAIQEAVARFSGTLTRVIVDDKGSNALSAWGIPGRQYEDDPSRAVRAGLIIQNALRAQGLSASVGISTGRVLCGLTGGDERCEYSLSGNAVNLAARLMSAQQGHVLCDAPTAELARHSLSFELESHLRFKGRAFACSAFRAIDRVPGDEPVLRDARHRSVMIGRGGDLDRLNTRLNALRFGKSDVVWLTGEPGIGKTHLLRDLTRSAKDQGYICLVGRADSVEACTMYFPWRVALLQFLRIESPDEAVERRRLVEAALAPHAQLQGWLALLNDVVPIGFPETPVTLQMSEQARAEGTAEIVVRLLEALASRRPMLLVFDDAQWMDSMSWQLAWQVFQRMAPVLIALSMRADHAHYTAGSEPSPLLAEAEHIELQPLNRDDTAALLGLRLGVNTIEPTVVSYVYDKAAGNPLFSEEVALMMRQSGHLRIDDDHCAWGENARSQLSFKVANTVQGVITSRIDLLSPAQRTTLKVASVLGPRFSFELLAAVLDKECGPTANLEVQFEAFARLELVVPDSSAVSRHFLFKHGITCDVAYHTLTTTEQRVLHEKVARWYERENAQDLAPFYSLLAHHWEKASNRDATLTYLHKAGEQAVICFANVEAIDFLERSLALLDGDERPCALPLQASCERLLGIALLWSGRLSESRVHLQASLALLGTRVPDSPFGQAMGSMVQFAKHLLRRIPGTRMARSALDAQERDVAMVMLRLGHVGYFQEDSRLMIFTCVRCIDFADRTAPCRESALMVAALSLAAGSVPLHRIAVRYGERALRIADLLDDASASAQVYLFYGIYLAGIGDWCSAARCVKRAELLSVVCNDNRRREECLVLDGFLHFHSGRCSTALTRFEAAAQAARLRGDHQTCAWGLLGVARTRFRQGRFDEALQALREAAPLASDRVSMIEFHGQLALVHLQRGAGGDALASARAGIALTARSRSTSFTTLTGLVGMAEALVELWSLARAGQAIDERDSVYRREADTAVRALVRFTKIFPIGTTSLLLLRGRQHQILGHPVRALRLWRQALASARQLKMPYEEAKAEIALASLLAHGEATALRTHAFAIFQQIASGATSHPILELAPPIEQDTEPVCAVP